MAAYAVLTTVTSQPGDHDDTRAFIRHSPDAAAAQAAAERRRIERELGEQAERARVAEAEAWRARRRALVLLIVGAIAVGAAALAFYCLVMATGIERSALSYASRRITLTSPNSCRRAKPYLYHGVAS
jgi:hypothetical protein